MIDTGSIYPWVYGGERPSPTSTAGALCPPVSNSSRVPAAPEEQPELLGPGPGPSPLEGCGWLSPGVVGKVLSEQN